VRWLEHTYRHTPPYNRRKRHSKAKYGLSSKHESTMGNRTVRIEVMVYPKRYTTWTTSNMHVLQRRQIVVHRPYISHRPRAKGGIWLRHAAKHVWSYYVMDKNATTRV
jgi:hypothetical protein